MDWQVFKRDDPSTWPEFDCPVLVCKNFDDDDYYFARAKWDNELKRFIGDGSSSWNECYYSYITYIPKGHKVYHPVRCKNDDNCKIGCNDNGYCMYDCECEQSFVVNEYEIIPKLIVKEFK